MDLDCACSRDTPAPNAYDVPAPLGASRAFTFGARTRSPLGRADGPDCCTYTVRPRHGGTSPSLAGRTRALPPQQTPGPGAYSPGRAGSPTRFFSLAGRTNLPELRAAGARSPGPGAYSPPARLGGPAASLAGRPAHGSFTRPPRDTEAVAPNTYRVERRPGADVPSFSLGGGRTRGRIEDTPGPGAYSPTRLVRGPAASFGVRAPHRGGMIDERKVYR